MANIYELQNLHWQNQSVYNYPIKREIFETLKDNLVKNKLMLSLEGPRRVGKSTLMKQLINYLLEQDVNAKDILYFSFDKYDKNVLDMLGDYEKLREKSLLKGKVYFFLDEIQKINDWQSELKIIYDNYPNIKIVVSGSTLRVSKKESLAGRIFEFFIQPLSFTEYLKFSGNESFLNVAMNDLFVKEYNIYLFRQYPDLAIDSTLNVKSYVATMIQKIIYEDSEKYIPDVDKDTLHKILNIILGDAGEIIDYNRLASDLGVSRKIVSEYLDFLIRSNVVRKIYNYSNNARKIEIKSKKFYPFCTTLMKYVSDNPDMSKVVETDVAFQLEPNYFLNNQGKEEIDFVKYNDIKKPIEKIGIEVKYKNYVADKDVRHFYSAIVEKIKLTKRYLIVKENSKLDFDTKQIVPVEYYLLWKNKKLFL